MKSAAAFLLLCYATLIPICFADLSTTGTMTMPGMAHTAQPTHTDLAHHFATYRAATESSSSLFVILGIFCVGVAALLSLQSPRVVSLVPERVFVSRARKKQRAWISRKEAGPPSGV